MHASMETLPQCTEAAKKRNQMLGTGRKQRTKSTYDYATTQPILVVFGTEHVVLASLPPQGRNKAGKRSGEEELSK